MIIYINNTFTKVYNFDVIGTFTYRILCILSTYMWGFNLCECKILVLPFISLITKKNKTKQYYFSVKFCIQW